MSAARNEKRERKELNEALGLRLKRLRTNAGMSQNDLAERSGVIRESISRLERGVQMPSAFVMRDLALALRVPLHRMYLIDDDPDDDDLEKYARQFKALLRNRSDETRLMAMKVLRSIFRRFPPKKVRDVRDGKRPGRLATARDED